MLRTRLFSSLRSRLIVLILLAVAPGMLLAFFLANEQRNLAYREVEQNNLTYLRLAEMNLGQLVSSTRGLLVTLSQMPQIQEGNREGCLALLNNTLRSSPGYRGFSVNKPNGETWCSAPAVPVTRTLNVAQREFFQRAVATKGFVIGGFQLGSQSGKGNLTFAYPLMDAGGTVQAVIGGGLDIEWLNKSIDNLRLPEGYVVDVLDRDGTFVVRWPAPENYVGTTPPDSPIIQQILSQGRDGREVLAEMIGVEGTRRLYAFSSVPGVPDNDLFVNIGISPEVAYAPINTTLLRNITALGLFALFTAVIAWVLGDALIVRRATRVINTAAQLRQGNLEARTGLSHDDSELGQLTHAIDEMAAGLQQRQQERDAAVAKLRTSEAEQRILAEVSAAAMKSVDYDESVRDIARAIVNRFSDICVIGITQEDHVIRQSIGAHKDPSQQATLDEVIQCCLPSLDLNSDSKFVQHLRQGEPMSYPGISPALLERRLSDERQVAMLTSLQLGSTLVLPLRARGGILGALTLIRNETTFPFDLFDMDLAREIAARVALALDSARLYQEVQKSNVELEGRVATRTAQLQLSNARLTQFQSALRDLSRRQNTLIEEERTRIAREVHDQLGQALTSIKMDLSAASRKVDPSQTYVSDKLRSAMALVDETVQTARRVAAELRPGALDTLGVVAAIEGHLREFEKRSGIQSSLHATVDETQLNGEAATAAFRILQEALTNVARHSQASQVRVTIEASADKLTLRVQDNGVGLADARRENSKSLGVLGMRERALALGGSLELTGASDQGTQLTLILPLSRHTNHHAVERNDQYQHINNRQ